MSKQISFTLQGVPTTISQELTIHEVIQMQKQDRANHIVAAKVNHLLQPLSYRIRGQCHVELVDLSADEGLRVYRNSLVFLLVRSIKEVMPGARVHIEHSISNGLYGEVDSDQALRLQDVETIWHRMQELVMANEPFVHHKMPKDQASAIFHKQELYDKVRLLSYSQRKLVNVHSCGWYYDTIGEVMVPSTGYLSWFKLRFYLPGFILEFPKAATPQEMSDYVEQGKLANVYYETERWSKTIGMYNAASLNEAISNQEIGDLIRILEGYHEKKIAAIADQITQDRDRLRIILIAGPSSSGKTTFAQRLSIQLRINGLNPISISLDDYFVNRQLTPLDEHGDYDFEALEAIDVRLFNEHLSQLIQGDTVERPTFNFFVGDREWKGHTLSVSADQPIIVEGIHGLNDHLTSAIPKGRKFKIYVSALTQLNVDDHTRIPTTDVRLLRRMIRDNQFRSHKPVETLKRWPSVRRGEEKHIFPFQEDADVLFNSALGYELSVLKQHGEPLLRAITNEHRVYAESRRLLSLLSHFHTLPAECDIPANSILREFIGGSCFDRS